MGMRTLWLLSLTTFVSSSCVTTSNEVGARAALAGQAQPHLDGNTAVVERPAGTFRFFAGCTAVSIVQHVRLHLACQDGRVRSYELNDDEAILVNELQLDGERPTLFVEQGRLWVRLGGRVEQLFPEQVLEVVASGESAQLPVKESPPPATAPGSSDVTRAGRIATEVLCQVGGGVGGGLVGGLLLSLAAWRPGATGLDLIAGPGLIGSAIGLGLALVLSPLSLAPVHRKLNGRGLAKHAWLGTLAGVALSALTLPFVLPPRPGGEGAISGGISLPLVFLAPIVGLEVGDAVTSQPQLAPTVNLSASSVSLGVNGRW